MGDHTLARSLTALAESLDFQRTAQKRELSQTGCTFEQLVHLGYLDIIHPSAANAQDVMMRRHVAVVARQIVQQSYLAGLSDLAELLQDPMNCSE